MRTLRIVTALVVAVAVATQVLEAGAITRRTRTVPRASAGLTAVCSKIQTFNPALMFYKNNKPRRAGSAITAPIIGYYKQMTLGYNAGKRGPLGSAMYDSQGSRLTTMVSYPCRSDHCGGRIVSAAQTDVTRRVAIKNTRSPAGYVSLGRGVCVEIPDIGRCYGNEVDKTRPLCNQVVG